MLVFYRWNVYNANHIGMALHHCKKREAFAEFKKLHPAPPEEFLSKLGEAAQDARTVAPQDQASASAVYASQILENPDFKSKGPVYRLNAWFSVVPTAAHKDKCFTLWREWLRWLARAMLGGKAWQKKCRDGVAQQMALDLPKGDSKEDHRQRLKQLKKHFSNSLLLGAVLTCNFNFWSMRLVLTVGQHFWLQQAFYAKDFSQCIVAVFFG